MNVGHVCPPLEASGFISVRPLVQALLSQIFQDDLAALDIFIARLNSAVLAATEAVILEVLVLAEGAFPEYVSGSHHYLLGEALVVLLEVRYEIECAVIRRGEPDVVLDAVVGLLHHELRHDGRLLQFLLACALQEVDELLAVGLAQEHGGDADAATRAVVTHDHVLYIFFVVIDYNGNRDTDVFHISDFLDERAIASLGDVEGGDVSVGIHGELLLRQLIACLRIIRVVIESANLYDQ